MTDQYQIRVLVVDDEPSIRESLTGYLDDCDYNVSSAESAEEALEMQRKEPFDIILADIRLPGMDGDDMILEAYKICPDTRYLIHTGSVHYQLTEEHQKIGLSSEHIYLKPLPDLGMIVEGIEKLIKDRQ